MVGVVHLMTIVLICGRKILDPDLQQVQPSGKESSESGYMQSGYSIDSLPGKKLSNRLQTQVYICPAKKNAQSIEDCNFVHLKMMKEDTGNHTKNTPFGLV